MSSESILNSMYALAEFSKKESASEIINELVELKEGETPSPEGKELVLNLRTVLNALERMAIGIKSDIYDERLLYSSYASFLISTCVNFLPYIRAKQIENSRYYVNIDWLYLRWKTKMDKKDG